MAKLIKNEIAKAHSKKLFTKLKKLAILDAFGDGLTVCNPKGKTYLGMVLPGQNRLIQGRGFWKPGAGHPWWGPTGSPNEQLGGANKWCLLVMATDFFGQNTLYTLAYAGSSLNCPGLDGTATHLYALMNDEPGKYDDNENKDSDPMRAG